MKVRKKKLPANRKQGDLLGLSTSVSPSPHTYRTVYRHFYLFPPSITVLLNLNKGQRPNSKSLKAIRGSSPNYFNYSLFMPMLRIKTTLIWIRIRFIIWCRPGSGSYRIKFIRSVIHILSVQHWCLYWRRILTLSNRICQAFQKGVFAHFTECVDVYLVGVNIQHIVDLDVPRLCRGVIVPRRYK